MSVILGKAVWLLLSPGTVLSALIVLALVLSWFQASRRWGIRIGVVALAFVLGLGILPVSDWLVRPLETYYPIPELPAKVDGIVVLGGSEAAETSAYHRQPQVNGSADRLIVFAGLARRYPEARLVFSGRGVSRAPGAMTEADVARGVFDLIGMDTKRVTFENQSRNTIENARFSLGQVKPKPGEVWVLVTSASHMPRAVNCFRAVGWDVLPYPVDFQTAGNAGLQFRPIGGLASLDSALKEWVGLIAYRLLGHTRDWLPPRDLATAGPAS